VEGAVWVLGSTQRLSDQKLRGKINLKQERRPTFDGVLVWSAPGQPKVAREDVVISPRFRSVEERIERA
jgi:hypothetical protein